MYHKLKYSRPLEIVYHVNVNINLFGWFVCQETQKL